MRPLREQHDEEIRRPRMPLEELGLLCLLEKVGGGADDLDGYARHGLFHQGLISGGPAPRLTAAGEARLMDLRAWRAEGDER